MAGTKEMLEELRLSWSDAGLMHYGYRAEPHRPEDPGLPRRNEEKRTVGMVGFEYYGAEDEIYLSSLHVEPRYRGAGYGTAMLTRICDLADRHGVDLYLNALSVGPIPDPELVAWYARFGFATTDPFPEMDGEPMVRRTNPAPSPYYG